MFTKKQAKIIVSSGRTQSYVPDVTIDKINTLYSSGTNGKKDIIKANMTRNKYGSLVYELDVQPKAFAVDKPIVARLNLSIRDVDKGIWFDDEEKRKYLKIRVIQCNSPEVTRKLIAGEIDVYSKRLSRIQGVKEVVLSAAKQGKITDYYNYRSGNGIIYKIPYEASFDVEDYDHLYYFAVCYLDVESMLEDGYLSKPPRKLQRYRGKIAAEPLTIRGRKVENRAAFVDQTGVIWQGPINFGPGPTSAGTADINNLRRVRVGNSKIHDYTLYDTLKTAIKLPEKDSAPRTYFSKSYISRDKNNACRFIFSFDYLSAIKDNNKFAGLTKSMPQGFRSARIKSIKVFRERVLEENYSPTKGSNSSKELICFSADSASGILEKQYNEIDSKKDNNKDSYVGSISEIRLRNGGRYRSFMVFDNSMSTTDDGKYRYSVEILMEDPTHKLLLKKLRKLRKIKKDMSQYYRRASGPGKFIHQSNRFSPSFVTAINEQQGIPTATEFNGSQDISAIKSAVWNRSVYEFLNILNTLTNKKFRVYYKKLSYMVRPSTGTVKGIGEFIKLIQHAEDVLTRATGPSEPGKESSSQDRADLKKAHGSMTRGAMIIKYTFDEVFNSSIINNLGYDYWGGAAKSSRSGLTYLTKNSLRERFRQGGKRTFSSLTPTEVRYSIGKVNLLTSKDLGDQAITANAAIAAIDGQAGSRSHSLPPAGAREGIAYDVASNSSTAPDPFVEANSGLIDVPLDATIDIYEEEQDTMTSEQTNSEDIFSKSDKFHKEGLDLQDSHKGQDRPITDVEARAIRDLASQLSISGGKDYLRNLSVGIEYYRGSASGGVADDSWEAFNRSVLSDDGSDEAFLVRLVGNNRGVQTGNLESALIGAFDEVVLVLPDSQNSEAQEPDDLQAAGYGSIEITYDEAEESSTDPDVVLIEQRDFYDAEEVYLEDQFALDGAYALPSDAPPASSQPQAVEQQAQTTARFVSEPTATYLIRNQEVAGAPGSPVTPAYSYSDTPGIINTGPRGMTITFSPYDLVMSARTRNGLETQMGRTRPRRTTSGGSRGGSSGGGY